MIVDFRAIREKKIQFLKRNQSFLFNHYMECIRLDVCTKALVLRLDALYGDTIRFKMTSFKSAYGIYTPVFILMVVLKLNIEKELEWNGVWYRLRIIDEQYLLEINRSKTIEAIIAS
jgi:hypothetical protein